jgi:septum formation topological specificity factor MinE
MAAKTRLKIICADREREREEEEEDLVRKLKIDPQTVPVKKRK